ncbi:hypothetical protein AX16_006506 [Volvariella volvacea WC 439]|nr:hypothetical protein AX16_006506 [Volvariella volvacea WC 439]
MPYTRKDGRSVGQARPIQITYDKLARSDGSARFAFSPSTLSLATTSGPVEVRQLSEQPSSATLDIHIRPLTSVPSTEHKSLSTTFKHILAPSLLLTMIPRTLVQVVVQGLDVPRSIIGEGLRSSMDGAYDVGGRKGGRGQKILWKEGIVASMLNSATLSLINSGSIPMRGVVCAISVAKLKVSSEDGSGTGGEGYVLVVDPGEEDEVGRIVAGGSFAFMFAHGLGEAGSAKHGEASGCECIWTNWRTFSDDGKGGIGDMLDLSEAKQLAAAAAKDIWEAMKKSIDPERQRRSVMQQVGNTATETHEEQSEREEKGEQEEDDDKMEIS